MTEGATVEVAPEGKRWECCSACQGKGKVLVDENVVIIQSDSAGTGGSDEKRLSDADEVNISPIEEKRKGNNRYGPRGTLRCMTCQLRKKKVCHD
jgi:hypothetical protein